MSMSTYNTIATVLLNGVFVAFAVIVISFIGMIVRWKTLKRRGHVIRMMLGILAVPCLIGSQQLLLWKVYLPSIARQQQAEAEAAQASVSLVNAGDSAPQFSLTTVEGIELAMPSRNNVVVINFFATWCGPCRLELPHLERIWNEYRGNEHLKLVVVGREESEETVRQFRDENGFTFPIAADPDRAVYSLFAKELIPRTVVVSPEGKVVYVKIGFNDGNLDELKAVIEQQLGAVTAAAPGSAKGG